MDLDNEELKATKKRKNLSEEEKKAIEYIKAQRGKYYKIIIDLLDKLL